MATSFAFLLFALLLAQQYFPGGHAAKVLILGGGLTGLQAAQTLKENGVDFLLLEASDHVGGRVAATGVDQVAADSMFWPRDLTNAENDPLGPWFEKCGFTWTDPVPSAMKFIDSTGADRTPNATVRQGEFFNILSKISRDYSNGLIPDSRAPSIEAVFTMYGWHATEPLDWYTEWYFYGDFGLTLSAQSAMYYLFLHGPKGANANTQYFHGKNQLQSGRSLPKCMSDRIFSGDLRDNLVLNAKVTSISRTESGVTVTTEGGATYQGDYAIVTFSLAVLQRNLVAFTPPLPFWKRLAWAEFSMIPVTNIYAEFDTKLPLDSRYYSYVTHELDFGWISNLDPIMGNLSEYANKTVFHVYVAGQRAARLEDQAWSKTLEDVNTMFRILFGKEPSNVYMTNASKDPLLLGGNTGWPVGASWEDFDDVRKPIGRLFFAGELCWYYLAARAPLISGKETANVVTSCMKGGSCTYRQFAQKSVETCPTSGARGLGIGSIIIPAVLWALRLAA
eukprot:m.180435 g.180435  ORF g.180435 m.180435 type:complete len:506 (+) comp39254_c0_seq1:147-1664(+)